MSVKSILWVTPFKTVQNKFNLLNMWIYGYLKCVSHPSHSHRPDKYGRALTGTESLRPVAEGKER